MSAIGPDVGFRKYFKVAFIIMFKELKGNTILVSGQTVNLGSIEITNWKNKEKKRFKKNELSQRLVGQHKEYQHTFNWRSRRRNERKMGEYVRI